MSLLQLVVLSLKVVANVLTSEPNLRLLRGGGAGVEKGGGGVVDPVCCTNFTADCGGCDPWRQLQRLLKSEVCLITNCWCLVWNERAGLVWEYFKGKWNLATSYRRTKMSDSLYHITTLLWLRSLFCNAETDSFWLDIRISVSGHRWYILINARIKVR